MAGDWIKLRNNLWDDPRVSRLCDLTDQTEATIIGALYWLWSSADQHTEDGIMPGLSLRQIDRKTGVSGFGEALCDIGWLSDHPEGVRIARFEEHNGASAKRRCMEAQRKANSRSVSASNADNEQTCDGQIPPKSGFDAELEKEKRREEVNPPTPRKRGGDDEPAGFAEFWSAYPRKVSKPQALKAWRKLSPDTQALPAILAGLERDRRSDQWLRDGGQFVPHPATWLNNRRWEDESQAPGSASAPAARLGDSDIFAGCL